MPIHFVVLCITIIGLPFGLRCFKLSAFALWPFDRIVVPGPNAPTVWTLLGNVMWFVLVGIWMALAHLVTGVLLCLTIIGIPLGLGDFKPIPLILFSSARSSCLATPCKATAKTAQILGPKDPALSPKFRRLIGF